MLPEPILSTDIIGHIIQARKLLEDGLIAGMDAFPSVLGSNPALSACLHLCPVTNLYLRLSAMNID